MLHLSPTTSASHSLGARPSALAKIWVVVEIVSKLNILEEIGLSCSIVTFTLLILVPVEVLLFQILWK